MTESMGKDTLITLVTDTLRQSRMKLLFFVVQYVFIYSAYTHTVYILNVAVLCMVGGSCESSGGADGEPR